MMYRHMSYSQHSMPSVLASDSDDLSDDELVNKVNRLKQDIKRLTLENEVLEKMMARVDPTLLEGIQQTIENALNVRVSSPSNLQLSIFVKSSSKLFPESSIDSSARSMYSSSRIFMKKVDSNPRNTMTSTILLNQGPRINLLERSEIVSLEMEMIFKHLDKEKKNAEKRHAYLNAQLEEIALREDDIKKAVDMFNDHVIVQGFDDIAQRIPAEIWVRFMREGDKITDKVIGKLRLRTSTLNTQYSRLKAQINEKADLSECLRPVDFDELKIKNLDINRQIDTKIHQLVELKKLTGEANLNLTEHKNLLFDKNNLLTSIENNIKQKKLQTLAINKEKASIQETVDSLTAQLEKVKELRQAYIVPDVVQYVKVKAELMDLQRTVKLLENRLRIHTKIINFREK